MEQTYKYSDKLSGLESICKMLGRKKTIIYLWTKVEIMEKIWNLTSLDTFCMGMVIKGAWVYKELPSFNRLNESLKTLLAYYPQLLGRYHEDIKAIVWDDDKLGTIHFEQVDCSGHTTAENPYTLVEKYDLKGFKKGEIESFSASFLSLDDGAAIVIQCAHATMDGYSFYTFAQQWAALTRGETITPMVVDQSLIPSRTALTKEETIERTGQLGWTKIGFGKLFKMLIGLGAMESIKPLVAFELSLEEIERMKSKTGASTNAVLSEFAIKKMLEKLPSRHSFKFIEVANLRGRVCRMPENFMGNFSQPVVIGEFDRDAVTSADLTASVTEAMSQTDTISENLQLTLCSNHYGLPCHYFDASDMNSRKPGTMYINNQLKFRANETDFGTGLPIRVEQSGLADMIKFWQPTAGGPVQIIYAGFAANIISRK